MAGSVHGASRQGPAPTRRRRRLFLLLPLLALVGNPGPAQGEALLAFGREHPPSIAEMTPA